MQTAVGTWNRSCTLILCLTALWLLLSACSKPQAALGAFEAAEKLSIAQVQKATSATRLNVAGNLVEKCPVAGCWFYLEDTSGKIKVDTKAAGFVVLDVPVGRKIEISGTLAVEGTERLIEATGLRFP